MRLFALAALAALLAACAPPPRETDIMSEGCEARGVSQWATGEASYSVEATTTGPDCARAVATLVIRDSSGAPLVAEAYLAQYIMVLAPARDPAAMQTALQEWVSYDNHTMATTSALPEWPANAEAPQNGEFPFYVAEGIDRAAYAELRQRNLPLFCYVQGMESMNCLALEDGDFNSIGVQTFPG